MADSIYDRVRKARAEARARHAYEMAAHWQYLGNRAHERGDDALAERHFQRSQKWRDQMNVLLGNGDGSEE